MFYINDKLRIRKLDSYSLQLEVNRPVKNTKTKTSEDKWVFAGYYGSLMSALQGALHYKLYNMVDEKTTLENIIRKINKAENEIVKALGDEMNKASIDEAQKKIIKRYTKAFEKMPE